MTSVVFLSVIALFRNFVPMVEGFADNGSFLSFASAIRHWNFQGLAVKAFWGLSYAMAGVSFITRLSDLGALLLICYGAGLATIVLAYRLWGGWIAGFFAVLNFDWMQRLFLGGSEPLFMALVLGAFLAARKQRWVLAALLASLGTTVRPVGIFALAGIGLALLLKRDLRNFSLATLTGLIVGGLYALPLALYFQTPLANVNQYQQADWEGGHLLTFPFHAIIKSTLSDHAPITNLILTWAWILFVLAGLLVLIFGKSCRDAWQNRSAEMIFAVTYVSFLFTYNSPHWIRGSFPRYSIAVLPLVLWALITWLPKDRRLLWGLAVISPVLAACSAIGIKNVASAVRHLL